MDDVNEYVNAEIEEKIINEQIENSYVNYRVGYETSKRNAQNSTDSNVVGIDWEYPYVTLNKSKTINYSYIYIKMSNNIQTTISTDATNNWINPISLDRNTKYSIYTEYLSGDIFDEQGYLTVSPVTAYINGYHYSYPGTYTKLSDTLYKRDLYVVNTTDFHLVSISYGSKLYNNLKMKITLVNDSKLYKQYNQTTYELYLIHKNFMDDTRIDYKEDYIIGIDNILTYKPIKNITIDLPYSASGYEQVKLMHHNANMVTPSNASSNYNTETILNDQIMTSINTSDFPNGSYWYRGKIKVVKATNPTAKIGMEMRKDTTKYSSTVLTRNNLQDGDIFDLSLPFRITDSLTYNKFLVTGGADNTIRFYDFMISPIQIPYREYVPPKYESFVLGFPLIYGGSYDITNGVVISKYDIEGNILDIPIEYKVNPLEIYPFDDGNVFRNSIKSKIKVQYEYLRKYDEYNEIYPVKIRYQQFIIRTYNKGEGKENSKALVNTGSTRLLSTAFLRVFPGLKYQIDNLIEGTINESSTVDGGYFDDVTVYYRNESSDVYYGKKRL